MTHRTILVGFGDFHGENPTTGTIPCPNQLFRTAKNYPLNDGKQTKHNTKRSPPGIKRGWKNHEKSLSMEGFKGPSTINGWIFRCHRYRRVKYLQLDNLVRFPSRLLLLNFAENPHLCRLNQLNPLEITLHPYKPTGTPLLPTPTSQRFQWKSQDNQLKLLISAVYPPVN